MELTRLSSKGQVVIPRAVREAMQLKVGTEFVVRQEGVSVILEPKAKVEKRSAEDIQAQLSQMQTLKPYQGKPVSIEDMDMAVTRMVRRDWRRFEQGVLPLLINAS